MQVPFYRHALSRADAERVAAVLDTPMLTSGPVGREVETQIAAYLGTSHALLTNSWTNGAIAVLLALGVGPGDDVIVPAMTFVATANVVALVGARPIFADVDADTLLLRTDDVLRRLTDRTRAVIPVHLYGQMVDVAGLRTALAAAGRPDVRIVEDAAHCFEGSLDGHRPGHDSDAAVFSFYATKNVTCGEGGAVVTRSADLADRILHTRLHGMSAMAADRLSTGRYRHWDMVTLGTKANLADVLAALLPGQIASVDRQRARRATVAQRYRDAFSGIGLRMPAWRRSVVHAHHLFPVHVPTGHRDGMLRRLADAGVGVTVNYRSVPSTTFYRDRAPHGATPVSDEWGAGTISLPCFPDLTVAEQDHVIAAVTGAIHRLQVPEPV